jgi:hypothetical protein
MERTRIVVRVGETVIEEQSYIGPGSMAIGRRHLEFVSGKYADFIHYVRSERDFTDFLLGEVVLRADYDNFYISDTSIGD